MHVHPNFEWIGSLRPPSWMTLLLIRWAVDNVHMAAVGLPTRPAGCRSKMLVAIRDTAAMMLPPFPFFHARTLAAPYPLHFAAICTIYVRHLLFPTGGVLSGHVQT